MKHFAVAVLFSHKLITAYKPAVSGMILIFAALDPSMSTHTQHA